jgi:DNA repair protein RecN (Recombination protein N)
MLRALELRDFVIAQAASLELAAGFTALTGETGAGKSILVDAIELLVGGRSDASLVRQGAERAELSAEFDVPRSHPLTAWLEHNDLVGDPERVLLRRTIDTTGRSRCFVNGRAATLAQLREAGELLVDIHGQHAHQSLLRPSAQRELLDAQAGAQALSAEVAEAYRAWKRLEEVAGQAQKNLAARAAERADLAEKAAALEKLSPREGEWAEVTALQSRLAHGSSLLAGAQSSLEALAEAEGACLPQLAAVAARLRALLSHDTHLAPIVEMLDSAHAQAGEAARELRHYASRVDLDPEALRDAETRIEAMHAAARRYRVQPDGLVAYRAEIEARLSELELAGDAQALEREVGAARARYEERAARLTGKRRGAAETMSRAVTAAMQQLAMSGGTFSVALRPLAAPGVAGVEEVEFEVASHASLPLRPLAKVASGGELSRISLALQLVAARSSPVSTLVFDEVDSGMGGAVAETIGRSLKKLGTQRQVLCVTHLPQVAAQADAQWSVVKTEAKRKVSVKVGRLDRAARIEELARMLGGAAGTARKHAAELLDAA